MLEDPPVLQAAALGALDGLSMVLRWGRRADFSKQVNSSIVNPEFIACVRKNSILATERWPIFMEVGDCFF